MMEFRGRAIKIDRELSDLDTFTINFIEILRKHSPYVIVSGYVSILLGRARASEDVDLIIPKLEFSKFQLLLKELNENNFYCLNAINDDDIYEYLTDKFAIRFAKNDTVIPNMGVKFAKTHFDDLALKKTIKVIINKKEIIISNLELQIAFKETVLKSPKDMEDAKHIRNIAKDKLNQAVIDNYKGMLDGF